MDLRPIDPADLAQAQKTIAGLREELDSARDELAAATHEIKRLSDILAIFQRHRFGRRSERLDPHQMELALEEIKCALGEVRAKADVLADRLVLDRPKRRNNLGALPEHLERVEQVIDIDDHVCHCCGGPLHRIGDDISERLDVVPIQLRVIATRRPRYGCRTCDKVGNGPVVQAPAPAYVVPSGLPTDRLVAQVLVSKFVDHMPLHRQARIYARQGITLGRSTLADWVGHAARRLRPLHTYLLEEMRRSGKLFADETVMPVLAPGMGRTKRGQFWAYARDDRPWGGTDPPAVAYVYAPDRKSERPVEHLAGFKGILQVDGYSGYNRIGSSGDVTLALCWAHARRRLYDLRDTEPVAAEVLRRIAALYRIEERLRGKPARERLAGRQHHATEILANLKPYLANARRRFSTKSRMAEAINYTLSHWDGLTRFMEDGRIELDSNIVERSIRPVALTRRNCLFAGTDQGAEHWAVVASLLETCRLNGIEPLDWLTAALTSIANGACDHYGDIMPWRDGRASE